MALVLADVGADAFLKARFNNDWPASKDLTLKLFVNNIGTVTDTMNTASFTEATGGGYISKTLTCGNWTIDTAHDPSDAVYAEQAFIFTGPLTTNLNVYGYYVVDGNDILQWAETIPQFTPVSNGDQLAITVRFQLSKGTPT